MLFLVSDSELEIISFKFFGKGVNVLKEILKASKNLGCKVLTVYAFSTENWTRPSKEVDFLINLFSEVLKNEIDEIHEEST